MTNLAHLEQPTGSGLTPPERARMLREAMRDKSYQLYPLGMEAAAFLRAKRKRLTKLSQKEYEGCLDKLARHYTDLELEDFERPAGVELIEEFLEHLWGECAPRTYNKNLSIVGEFFKFQVARGRMQSNPCDVIERAKAQGVERTVFNVSQRRAIIASQTDLRDRIALRLLLDYALRKGSLRAVQFKHFDHVRKRLTIFAKGGVVRNLPIPDPAFWHDLERLILDTEAEGQHFLLQRTHANRWARTSFPFEPMGHNGMHIWWYRCLANAGIVAEGTKKGERMHKARHSAGQRLLDHSGNLKAVQMLLGHESISTTGDIYTDWDEGQLAASLESVLEHEEDDE
jgi:site-specific recombinase XerD